MSLASERSRGALICQCPQPDHRPVVMLNKGEGSLTLIDVFECARCGKPLLEQYRRHLDAEAS